MFWEYGVQWQSLTCLQCSSVRAIKYESRSGDKVDEREYQLSKRAQYDMYKVCSAQATDYKANSKMYKDAKYTTSSRLPTPPTAAPPTTAPPTPTPLGPGSRQCH